MHRLDGPKRKWGRYIWELPCLCTALDYQLEAKASRGQVDTGFSEMVINRDLSFNFNESRSFLLDEDCDLDTWSLTRQEPIDNKQDHPVQSKRRSK